jgi:hypothetical protein
LSFTFTSKGGHTIMAILKIKALIRDLQGDGREVLTSEVSKASFTFTAPQLRGLFNKILAGTNLVVCGTGIGTVGADGCWGATIFPVCAVINGRVGTIGTQAQVPPPKGTQAANTYCKYLISSGFGSSGTITAGNQAASSTAALLPELPANHVALGFFEYLTPATPIVWRTADAGTAIAFSGGVGAGVGTGGTCIRNGAVVGANVDGVTQLACMPFLQ